MKPPPVYPFFFKDLKPKRRNKKTESVLVNAALKWLWMHGCFVWRNNTGAYKSEATGTYVRYGHPGSPDLIGVTRHGRFIGVECKSAKGTVAPHQKAFGENITQHGGIYIVARSLDDLEAQKHLIAHA